MKIKFDRYDMTLHGREYCILIPQGTEQLWIAGYGNAHWGLSFYGNRKGLEAMLYSVAVLAFNPKNKIIYFPIRNNFIPDMFYYKNIKGEEEKHCVDQVDLIFTTDQMQLKRNMWKELRAMMRFRKPRKYILNYDENRTVQYFKRQIHAWWEEDRHYIVETVEQETLFYVYNRRHCYRLFLMIQKFLERDLEGQFRRTFKQPYESLPEDELWLNYASPKKENSRKLMGLPPWVLFYDTDLDEEVTRTLAEKL